MADDGEQRASRWLGGRYLERGEVRLRTKEARAFEAGDFAVYVLVFLCPPLIYTRLARLARRPLLAEASKRAKFVRKQLCFVLPPLLAVAAWLLGWPTRLLDKFEIFAPAVLMLFRALALARMEALCGVDAPPLPAAAVTLLSDAAPPVTTAGQLVRLIHSVVMERDFNRAALKARLRRYRLVGAALSLLLCLLPIFGRWRLPKFHAGLLFGRTWTDCFIYACFAGSALAFGQWFFVFLCHLSKFFRYLQACLRTLADGTVGSVAALHAADDPDERRQRARRPFALDVTHPFNLKAWLDIRDYYHNEAQQHVSNQGLRVLCLLFASGAVCLVGVSLWIINVVQLRSDPDPDAELPVGLALSQLIIPTSLQGYLSVVLSTHTAVLCVELCSIVVGLATGHLLIQGAAINSLLSAAMAAKLHDVYIQAELDYALGVAAAHDRPVAQYTLQLKAATRLLPLMKNNLAASRLGIFGYSFDAILSLVRTFLVPTLIKLVLDIFS